MIHTSLKFAKFPKTYSELVEMHVPRPLHDRADRQNTEEIVLAMAGHSLTADQEDYLDLLSDMLLKYEAQRPQKRKKTSALARLIYLLDESGTSRAELARLLGCSQPLISLILAGKRSLTIPHVRVLASHFKLDAGYFV